MLKVRSEKSLGFNVCRIVPYRHAGGDYLLLCGSNRQCQLFSCEGYPLGSVADCNKWVWATAAKPNSTIVVIFFGIFQEKIIIIFLTLCVCVYSDCWQ